MTSATMKGKPEGYEYPCTECKGNAYVGYSHWRRSDRKKPFIKKGERLCLSCAKKRGVTFWK